MRKANLLSQLRRRGNQTVTRKAKQSIYNYDAHFFNRELSWLEFNARVLDEALCADTPLLEKLKFLSIFSQNQDEFFMVRVAGLKKMLKEGFFHCESPDRMPISAALAKIFARATELGATQYRCLHQTVLPALADAGIVIKSYASLGKSQQAKMTTYFTEEVFPILTPLAVDPSHPYPFLTNLAIYLLIEFEPCQLFTHTDHLIGFVEIPSVIRRLIPLPTKASDEHHFVLLEDLVRAHLSHLFPGFAIASCSTIRVTRNLDYKLLENNVVDLLEFIQKEVINREQQEVVRLELSDKISAPTVDELKKILNIEADDIYYLPAPMHIPDLLDLYNLPLPELRAPEFNPRLPARMAGNVNMFGLIKERDLLVHHPYESFYAVIEFLNSAATDPDVYAIKQTLYRSSGDSPIVDALIKAAENGKHVTAVVELKARFDERNNIVWARRLERAGVNVVYGFVGLKTHCKATLVIRKENARVVRYVHLSTGNYNSQTARLYTDLGLFTAAENIGKDISALFNLLTGFNILTEKGRRLGVNALPHFHELVVAPLMLRTRLLKEIDRVILAQKKGQPTLIMAKLNGLVDKAVIERLYRASQAGVRIKLIVRGICCLRPGIAGLSDNIEVISIVDRFLEHSRIYYFRADTDERLFLASADWMARSMDRRIEIMYPVYDEGLKQRLSLEILNTYWQDNQKARLLLPDGTYTLRQPLAGEQPVRAQSRFIEMAREGGIKSLPYDRAIWIDPKNKGRPVANQASSFKKTEKQPK